MESLLHYLQESSTLLKGLNDDPSTYISLTLQIRKVSVPTLEMDVTVSRRFKRHVSRACASLLHA